MLNQKESNINETLQKLQEVGQRLEAIDESKLNKDQLAKIEEAKAKFIQGALGVIKPNIGEIENVLEDLKKAINLDHIRSELSIDQRDKFDRMRPEIERLSKEGDYKTVGELIKNI